MKEVQVVITKDGADPRERIFVSHNLQAMTIEVGKPCWIPEEHYKILSKGNLKERVTKISEREMA